MRNLKNLRSFFSSQEQLSVTQLQTLRGGAISMNTQNTPWGNQNAPGGNQNAQVQSQNSSMSALDDNKRPERPGGGVSTH